VVLRGSRDQSVGARTWPVQKELIMITHWPSVRPLVRVSVVALALCACNGRLEVTDQDIGDASLGLGGTSAGGTGGGGGGDAGVAGNAGAAGAAGSGDTPCTNGAVECDSKICLDGVCQPPRCDDGVQNADEDSIDCGGGCGPCLTRCQSQCAVSDVLIPIGCDPEEPAPIGVASLPRVNDDGTIIAFDHCFADSRCAVSTWTATGGARPLPVTGGATLSGMSEDGQLVLVNPQAALGGEALLFSPDGTSAPAGIARGPALVAASGVLVGVSPPTSDAFALLRRPRAGEIEPLGALPFGSNQFGFTGATPDASTIVGYSFAETFQPFRYTDADGLVFGLEGLPETADGATIDALSRDGRALAGVTMLGSQRRSVFRWTEADGVVELAPVVPSTPGIDPAAMALSDDGSVLVFSRETNAESGDFSAFRWTASDGIQALTPGIQSAATLVSGDGSVIIGQTLDVEAYRAYVWTPARGARAIRAELEAAGVDLTGWSFGTPQALSRDGKVGVGVGTCGGVTTVYRLVLPE
jgi:hypothetical protein